MGVNHRNIYVDACCRNVIGFCILLIQCDGSRVEKYHIAEKLRTDMAEKVAILLALRGTENEENDVTQPRLIYNRDLEDNAR